MSLTVTRSPSADRLERLARPTSRDCCTRRFVALALSLVGGVAATAYAAPFTNGDFELPAVDTQFHEFDATRNAPAGWVATGGAGCVFDERWLHVNGNPDVATASGWQFVDLQRGGLLGSISQTFDTVPGQPYRVAFDLSAITYDPDGVPAPPQMFTLDATAASAAQAFSITTGGYAFDGNGLGTEPWTPESFTFTAAAASSTLTLANETPYAGGLDDGTAIDAVTVTALAEDPPTMADVPEPAPTLLFALAAAGLLLRWCRRNGRVRRGIFTALLNGTGRPAHAATVGASTLLAVCAVASAAPFINGDFEQPATGVAFSPFSASGGAPAGWAGGSGGGYIWNAAALHTAGYGGNAAASGNQFVGLQQDGQVGIISQTFDTDPGATYEVDLAMSATTQYANGSNPSQQFALAASAAGTTQDFTFGTCGYSFGGLGVGTDPWAQESFDFTAADAATTLTLANLTPYVREPDFGTDVDDVVINEVVVPPSTKVTSTSVPEPAPILLLGLAAAGLLLRRSRGNVAV